MRRLVALVLVCGLLVVGAGCGPKDTDAGAQGGTAPQRLVIGFVPSADAEKIPTTVAPLAEHLAQDLDLDVEHFTSTNYVGLIEAMGSGKVDVGFLPSFGYVLANSVNGAQVILKSQRNGEHSYRAQFVVRADDGYTSITDLQGKRVAFVDPSSASGYLFPAAHLKQLGFDPDSFFRDVSFAGGHDNALLSLYNGTVDLAVTFEDARTRIQQEYPDVMDKLTVIGYTEAIPNDTVSVRPGLDNQLVERIRQALVDFSRTEQGQQTLRALYQIDGFVPAADSDYDVIRETARLMDLDLETGKPRN